MSNDTPAFDWRDYLPLAKAETTKFYRKQERGRFERKELLSVAVEALATSPGVAYAHKAIHGALTDYVRDSHKVVRNVELTEEEYRRTTGGPAEKKAPKPKTARKFFKEQGVRGTVYSKGPYRSNEQLLRGDCKVSSKHNKVSVALWRSSYNDEWSQTSSGRKRSKIEDEEDRNYDPRAGLVPQRGEINQGPYSGRGREKRFSNSCVNYGTDWTRGLWLGWKYDDGKVEVGNPNPRAIFYIPRVAKSELAPHAGDTFTLRPVPADKLGHWREELVFEGRLKLSAAAAPWQRESGRFRIDWGLPDRPNGWGYNWLEAYLDRWELDRDKTIYSLRLKSSVWADIPTRDSLEQDVPRRLALAPPALVVLEQAELF